MGKWRPEERALLGSMDDESLAEVLGRTVKAVETQRELLGIRKSGCADSRS